MITDDDDEAEGREWCPRDELKPLVMAKCQTMRLLVNNCLASVDDEGAAKLVAKLLLDTLDQDGSFAPPSEGDMDRDRLKDPREGCEISWSWLHRINNAFRGAPARSWIRLKAAKCLLRMAQKEKFATHIFVRLPTLALVAQVHFY